jgi:hypothetical protein
VDADVEEDATRHFRKGHKEGVGVLLVVACGLNGMDLAELSLINEGLGSTVRLVI